MVIGMKRKGIMALLLCGMLTASMLTGCGKEIDKTAVLATAGETEVSLGFANFAARFQQAQSDDFYAAYFGENVWNTDMYGNGVTMKESLKEGILDSIHAMYALEANMAEYGVELTETDLNAIREAAAAFMEQNSAEAIEALGATTEIVEEYLRLLTIESKMYDEVIKGADTNVTDEEANTSAYSYVYISNTTYTDEEGQTVEYKEEEKAALKETVNAFVSEAKADTLEDAAANYGYTVSKGTYNADSVLSEEITAALDAMTQEGVVADLVESDNGYYVLRMDAFTDAEATEANREAIISERQTEYYMDVVEHYQEETAWSVNKNLWKKVSFDNLFTIYPPSTEEAVTEDTEIN